MVDSDQQVDRDRGGDGGELGQEGGQPECCGIDGRDRTTPLEDRGLGLADPVGLPRQHKLAERC